MEDTYTNDHFIYVFSKQDKDELLALGFTLLKSNEKSDVYIFENDRKLTFAIGDRRFLMSDILTF